MQDHIHKAKEDTDQLVSMHSSKNQYALQFTDNRPEAVNQQRQQEFADNSPRSAQLKALRQMTTNNQPVFQLKPYVITQDDQLYKYGPDADDKVNVGSVMEVVLDGEDMQGQSANMNDEQNDMMDAIRDQWGIDGGDVVKGHLLNDNLGGSALNENLYPISRAANSDHLGFVENAVKELAWKKQLVYYKVEVDATPNIKSPNADFDCEIRSWDPQTNSPGKLLFEPTTIQSDLTDTRAYNEAFETYSGQDAERHPKPRKPKWAKKPKTKVGELTKKEYLRRLEQKKLKRQKKKHPN